MAREDISKDSISRFSRRYSELSEYGITQGSVGKAFCKLFNISAEDYPEIHATTDLGELASKVQRQFLDH